MKTDPRVGALRPKDAARYLGIGMETLRTSSVLRDEALFRELVVPTYESRGGKVVVEAKEVIRKRLGGATPDRADAVVYGNWVRSRAAAADPEPRRGSTRGTRSGAVSSSGLVGSSSTTRRCASSTSGAATCPGSRAGASG